MVINNKQDRKQEGRNERMRKQARLIALAVAASGEAKGRTMKIGGLSIAVK